MSERLLRNYSKTEAERREIQYQKFLDRRASLDQRAKAMLDQIMVEEYAESCEDAKTQIARRQQELLDQKVVCLQQMSPAAREVFHRKIGPAVRNGDNPAIGLETENLPAQRTREIRRKTRQVFAKAVARDDLTNANRALQNLIRLQQLEASADYDLDGQDPYYRGPEPLPGAPGGRPLTEKENKFYRQFYSLSSGDCWAMREAIAAAQTYMKLDGDLADLVKECGRSGQQAVSGQGGLRKKVTWHKLRFLS